MNHSNWSKQLNTMLLEQGALPGSFSINNPENYRLNMAENPDLTYSIWFQDDGGRYEQKTFSNLGEAVYNFATRLVSTQSARQIAEAFHDPVLEGEGRTDEQ